MPDIRFYKVTPLQVFAWKNEFYVPGRGVYRVSPAIYDSSEVVVDGKPFAQLVAANPEIEYEPGT